MVRSKCHSSNLRWNFQTVENYKLFKITYLVCYFNVNQVKATEEEWCCCMYVAIAVISAKAIATVL